MFALSILAATNCATLFANELIEFPMTRKIHDAELIFTGEVSSSGETFLEDVGEEATELMRLDPENFPIVGWNIDYVVVKVRKVLKGDLKTEEVRFVVGGPIAEDNPTNCCKKNDVYLFFVTESESLFYSVNGRYAVYPVVNNQVLGWQSDRCSDEKSLAFVEDEIKKALVQ